MHSRCSRTFSCCALGVEQSAGIRYCGVCSPKTLSFSMPPLKLPSADSLVTARLGRLPPGRILFSVRIFRSPDHLPLTPIKESRASEYRAGSRQMVWIFDCLFQTEQRHGRNTPSIPTLKSFSDTE